MRVCCNTSLHKFSKHADTRHERRRDNSRRLRKRSARHELAEALPVVRPLESPEDSVPSPARSSYVQAPPEQGSRVDFRPEGYQEAGYIAGHSVLLSKEVLPLTPMSIQLQNDTLEVKKAVLKVTEADILPKPALQQALIEAYFDHLYHRYPIVEMEELQGSRASLLLVQAVCMAGSLMRHGRSSASLSMTHSLYEKVKTLIYLRYESDSLAVLKAMCLVSTWSPNPSDSLSLDGPWHWTGAAIRLAFQIGLHKQSSYSNKPDASTRRLIWWLLFVGANNILWNY